jgi:DnaK suppressor protein
MTAKKPVPKAAKGKKVASHPVARKSPVHKPVERAKAVVQARKSAAAPPPAAVSKKVPHRTLDTSVDTIEMPEAAEPTPVTAEHPAPSTSASSPRVHSTPVASTAAAENDDSDAIEPGSLLAGPRNVQPYIVKRGELYMSKEQLEHFRQILLSWKRDLMEEVDRTVSHMKDEAANFPDPNDRATQEEEFSLELRTRDRERKLIRKIEEALKRVEDGSYGYCLETGEEIGIKRLEARPVATLTLEAQERRERRERQYGDRDDRYR